MVGSNCPDDGAAMSTIVKRGMTLLIASMMIALSGCAYCSKVSCAAPHAELPETVSPGETLTVEVEDLWICPDKCGATPVPMSNVAIEAATASTGDVVATATAPVDKQATANVSLTIPNDAEGSLTIRTSETEIPLGTVDVLRE